MDQRRVQPRMGSLAILRGDERQAGRATGKLDVQNGGAERRRHGESRSNVSHQVLAGGLRASGWSRRTSPATPYFDSSGAATVRLSR